MYIWTAYRDCHWLAHGIHVCLPYLHNWLGLKVCRILSLWYVMWKLVLRLLYSFPSRRALKKSLFLFLPWPQTISMRQFLTLVWITGYFPLANSLEESCCNQFRGHCASSMCFLILCCKWFPEELNFCCFCPCWSTPCILLKQDQFWDLDCPFFLTKVFSLKLNNKTRTLWHSFFVVVVVKMLSLYVYVLFLEQAIFLPVPLLYLRTHLI